MTKLFDQGPCQIIILPYMACAISFFQSLTFSFCLASYYSRLSLIQAMLNQQQWRVPSLLRNMSDYLSTQLDHPFKNVREKIGRYFEHAIMYLMYLQLLIECS